jgi:hypothetical protein
LLGLTLVDLLGFGLGLNPSIERGDDRPVTPLIEHLRRVAPPPLRVLGVGEELPPNVAMRYGLADVRNYDSIELAASVDSFAMLYPPGPGERTSRREVTWAGVLRARDRLREAGVAAIVAASPPPEGAFAVVEKVGSAWVARPEPGPFAAATIDLAPPGRFALDRPSPGRFRYRAETARGETKGSRMIQIEIQEISDGNWADSGPSPGAGHIGPGSSIHACGAGAELRGEIAYRPASIRVAAMASCASLFLVFFAVSRPDSP